MILPDAPFDRSVFVNCPFDQDYAPILQAILFCLIYSGVHPRIGSESLDGGRSRLDKIQELIENSLYSIHDLSRSVARRDGDPFRLNMPFELGMDYACRLYFGHGRDGKKMLILGESKSDCQRALSDIAGFDIEAHAGNFELAIRRVRNWLCAEAGIAAEGAARIKQRYEDFQAWHYERQLSLGFSEDDIRDYPTPELMAAMVKWRDLGQPATFT